MKVKKKITELLSKILGVKSATNSRSTQNLRISVCKCINAKGESGRLISGEIDEKASKLFPLKFML
jgi:hypothetical protein